MDNQNAYFLLLYDFYYKIFKFYHNTYMLQKSYSCK